MELRKFIRNAIRESLNDNIWYHGSPNDKLNFNLFSKGNQIPYGVHFTQNKNIAYDFASGLTKMKPTENGYIFICEINTDNIFDISTKHVYIESDEYYNILNEICVKSKIKGGCVSPAKGGTFYHQKYLGKIGFVNKIDAGMVLDNAKPNIVLSVLKKYKIDPVIKYKMISYTDMLGYKKVYTDAICVLSEEYVKILSVETLPYYR